MSVSLSMLRNDSDRVAVASRALAICKGCEHAKSIGVVGVFCAKREERKTLRFIGDACPIGLFDHRIVQTVTICLGKRNAWPAAWWMRFEDERIGLTPKGGLVIPLTLYEEAMKARK